DPPWPYSHLSSRPDESQGGEFLPDRHRVPAGVRPRRDVALQVGEREIGGRAVPEGLGEMTPMDRLREHRVLPLCSRRHGLGVEIKECTDGEWGVVDRLGFRNGLARQLSTRDDEETRLGLE